MRGGILTASLLVAPIWIALLLVATPLSYIWERPRQMLQQIGQTYWNEWMALWFDPIHIPYNVTHPSSDAQSGFPRTQNVTTSVSASIISEDLNRSEETRSRVRFRPNGRTDSTDDT